MRVTPQVQAEMAVILGGVFGLGLRAQHHFVHQRFGIVSPDLRQHAIEQGGAQRAAFRERQIEGFEEFLQVMNLLERRFIVHPVNKRQRLLFKHFGGGDIGQNHKFFDQFVRIEPFRDDDAIDGAVGFQQDLALGNVEIERIALVARALDHRIGVVERLQDRSEQGAGGVVGPAVDRGLGLRVVQLGGRAHQNAMKAVRALAAVIADHHPHRQRAARFARHQRAQIVGDALGQHRHHAIGEIHRIAAHQRIAVERRSRPHIKCDVGDRDIDDVAALVVRIGIRLGVNRVVVILGVGRIDRDQRDVAPVLAPLQGCGFCLFGLAQGGRRERLRNFVGVDGDQADRLLRCQRAEPLLDLAGSKPEAARANEIDADEIAVLGAIAVGLCDVQFAAGLLLVDRDQPSAAPGKGAEDSEHAGLGVIDDLDDPPAIDRAFAVALSSFSTRSSARSPTPAAVPGCGRRGTWIRIFGASPLSTSPIRSACDQFAVAVAPVMSAITWRSAAVPDFFAPHHSRSRSSSFSRRRSARSPTPAAVPGCGRRGT